jgi:uncharacterized protein YlzI (FlbEa/FlbD family)
MVWIPLTSPSGRTQYFNADNIVVFRELSGLEAGDGTHSKIWLQTGTAQVREKPDDILKLIAAGLVQLTAINGQPIYFNPTACTQIGKFVATLDDKKNADGKTQVRTVNNDFPVKEDIETVLKKFEGEALG